MNETGVAFNTQAAKAMRAAFEDEKDGGLFCETSEAKRVIFFECGHIVGARSDLLGERLGEVLVREGKLRREELEEATRFIRTGRKLGQILVELGYLKGGEIERYVRLQIIEIASRILLSSADRLVFSETIPVQAVTLSPVSIGDVFLEASKRLTDTELYRENVLIDDYVLAQTEDAVALSPGMNFSAEEAHLVDLIDGKHTVREILSLSGLDREATVRLLVGLHQAGILALKEKRADSPPPFEPESSAAPEPDAEDPFEQEVTAKFHDMQCQNHWQVLGLESTASFEQIDRAYREHAARFDPEKHRHITNTQFQERLSFIQTRLKEAFVTLSSKTSTNVYARLDHREEQYQEEKQSWETIPASSEGPTDWERPRDPEEGKVLFLQARRAFKEQDFWRTIELCRASIDASGENDPERFHLLGLALAQNPRWRKDAEQNFKIAHNLKPWEPKYLLALGKLYEQEGLHQRAKRTFDQLRAIDPIFAAEEETGN